MVTDDDMYIYSHWVIGYPIHAKIRMKYLTIKDDTVVYTDYKEALTFRYYYEALNFLELNNLEEHEIVGINLKGKPVL